MSETGETPTRHGKHAEDTDGITFRVSKATKRALVEIAKRDGRTLSNFMRTMSENLARRSRAARRKPAAA